MNILQNLFQHSKALFHLNLAFFSLFLKLTYRAKENLGSLLERAEY